MQYAAGHTFLDCRKLTRLLVGPGRIALSSPVVLSFRLLLVLRSLRIQTSCAQPDPYHHDEQSVDCPFPPSQRVKANPKDWNDHCHRDDDPDADPAHEVSCLPHRGPPDLITILVRVTDQVSEEHEARDQHDELPNRRYSMFQVGLRRIHCSPPYLTRVQCRWYGRGPGQIGDLLVTAPCRVARTTRHPPDP